MRYLDSAELLTNDGWKIMEHRLPLGIEFHCMVLVDKANGMIIAGDSSGNISSNKTYFFNFDTKLWRHGPELILGRSDHACGMIKKDANSNEVKNIFILVLLPNLKITSTQGEGGCITQR